MNAGSLHRARWVGAALIGLIAGESSAQKAPPKAKSTFDRTVVPVAGKRPDLRVPSWTKVRLANGAALVVSERHNLPLVSVSIAFRGGSSQFEPANKTGVARLVAGMLTEGTTTKTGDEISNAMQLLGSTISTSIGSEAGSIGFDAMKDKLEPLLALTADLVVNPTFPAEALERRRANYLVSLQQAKDVTGSIASVVFPKVVYATEHPYGRTANESSVKAITRNDLVAFHRGMFQPGRAEITVVGDVKPDDARRLVERAFAQWSTSGSAPGDFAYPALPAAKPTAIYLVDKPDAEQSSFALGGIGPARDTPDYFALRVMNTLFGELFQSRLNANIREQKGFSYGVGSRFAFGHGPGVFRAGGDIVTAKTDSALIEFMKEIRGVRGDRAVTDEEMENAKNSLVQSLPDRFSSMSGIGESIDSLYLQGLPETFYQQYGRSVAAVTKDDVVRVARKYIDPDHLAIVIVGDRKVIEAPLRATKIAPIVLLDVDGNPIRDSVRP